MILSETQLCKLIVESVCEAYNKWFQTEQNNVEQCRVLMRQIGSILGNINNTKPQRVWETIRKLGYLNHSAFKVIPGMWEKFPDEELSHEDYNLNQMIYGFKRKALAVLVEYYLSHGFDVSTDETRNIIYFREPTTGVRQISFHLGKDNDLANNLSVDGSWDGVKQAHHYDNDEDYTGQLRNSQTVAEGQSDRLSESYSVDFQTVIGNILNYIRTFGEKGKLPSFDGRLKDVCMNGMKEAYRWATESVDGVQRYGFASFVHDFNIILSKFTYNKRGLIYVERSIDLDVSQGFDDMNFKSIGECWSWQKGGSSSYCADFSLLNNNVWNVVLCGYVHPNSVNWTETIYLNSYHMKNEKEIRMNDNAFVEVGYVKINGRKYPLGSSMLINASADKYLKG